MIRYDVTAADQPDCCRCHSEQRLPLSEDDADDVLLHLDEATLAGRTQLVVHRPAADERLVRDGVDRERAVPVIPVLLPYVTQRVRVSVGEDGGEVGDEALLAPYRSNSSSASASQY
jgi:hypothetical protein